jgi:hypothetical protein
MKLIGVRLLIGLIIMRVSNANFPLFCFFYSTVDIIKVLIVGIIFWRTFKIAQKMNNRHYNYDQKSSNNNVGKIMQFC